MHDFFVDVKSVLALELLKIGKHKGILEGKTPDCLTASLILAPVFFPLSP